MSEQVRFDRFVESLMPDPNESVDVIVLTGYCGRSHRDGYIRVYATAELSSFVEVALADVRHSVPLNTPLGGSVIWVSRTARVQRTSAGDAHCENDFLHGPITSAHMGTAAPSHMVTGGKRSTIGSPTIGFITSCFCNGPDSNQ